MARNTNVANGAMNAQIVRTRKEHRCLYCNKALKKGIRAKTYYINGLGRQHFCLTHHRDDVVLAILDLL